jgi:MinD-like ATPase involved in chromosome partitioning or flagellar assembly
MRPDQATRLRLLVSDETSDEVVAPPRAWRTLSVVGAKGGVGTSTVALNLAVALSVSGCRVELTTASVLEGDTPGLSRGPAGVVLLGETNWQRSLLWQPRWSHANQFRSHTTELADWLIVDRGTSPSMNNAESMLLVTTPEPASILAAFDVLRSAHADGITTELLINRAGTLAETERIKSRFLETARRLLACRPNVFELIEDDAVLDAARLGRPVALARPACLFSRGVQRLVDVWTSAGSERAA